MTDQSIMSKNIPLAPFSDPRITAKGERRASVKFDHLKTLWFNTGSLCNIACVNCYIESSPTADHFAYLSSQNVRDILDELDAMKHGPIEIGLTGGEPFMNPHILDICRDILDRGHELLILSNAMRPMMRPKIQSGLKELQHNFDNKITLRISLDHYSAAHHDQLRGAGNFEKSVVGINWLSAHGFVLSLAGRSIWGESEDHARAGFADLCTKHEWAVDCADPAQMVIFPEMDDSVAVPEITTKCWDILKLDPQSMMCANSRMVVRRKGEAGVRVLSCTLLWNDDQFDLGPNLDGAIRGPQSEVSLNHPHCAKFCVLGGASCSA